MTEVLLIRHATAAHIGRVLAGRAAGLSLEEDGRTEATALGDALAGASLAAVYTSPSERARETAALIGRPHGHEPRSCAAFDEVDFGEWTGMSFEALSGRADWRAWNERRSTTRAPGGESMDEVVARALTGLDEIRARHPGERIAVVSHCDVIRPLVAHVLRFSLDAFHRMEIDTASVSALELGDEGAMRALCVNWTVRPHWSRG